MTRKLEGFFIMDSSEAQELYNFMSNQWISPETVHYDGLVVKAVVSKLIEFLAHDERALISTEEVQ